MLNKLICTFIVYMISVIPTDAFASSAVASNYTSSWFGTFSIFIFVFAYTLVILEEKLHLHKSKPVIFASGLIWISVALMYISNGLDKSQVHEMIQHNFSEYAELAFFLISAMTFVNVIVERNIFVVLSNKLAGMGLSLRNMFWVTGTLAFFISPVADNLTTALILGSVAMAVGAGKRNFIVASCINIVVAANAGGAFSPFGDITTLMVWQKGVVQFGEFFNLFLPALASWLVPALIMSFSIEKEAMKNISEKKENVKFGGLFITFLFLFTIATTVIMHSIFEFPTFMGMMIGFSNLMLCGYFIKQKDHSFDIFKSIMAIEWDTLFFFYGVILCVGGLNAFGYLSSLSHFMYNELGALNANIIVGLVSSVLDNIPVVFSILTMHPDMNHSQWLLVTLTSGIGGSLLSVGSAAGVALMGQARGTYTFMSHLKWTWAVALGYAVGVGVHVLVNGM